MAWPIQMAKVHLPDGLLLACEQTASRTVQLRILWHDTHDLHPHPDSMLQVSAHMRTLSFS